MLCRFLGVRSQLLFAQTRVLAGVADWASADSEPACLEMGTLGDAHVSIEPILSNQQRRRDLGLPSQGQMSCAASSALLTPSRRLRSSELYSPSGSRPSKWIFRSAGVAIITSSTWCLA